MGNCAYDCSRQTVTGILGKSITLQFTFNISVTDRDHFIINTGVGHSNKLKVAEYINGKPLTTDSISTHPKNGHVICRITNLKKTHRGLYWASLFKRSIFIQSETVELIVREENNSSTAPTDAPAKDDILTTTDRGISRSPHIMMIVLVVSPVVLVAAALTWLIWSLIRAKDKKEQSPQQNSSPTIQETVEASNPVSAASVVYSVLDFPKRASAVVEINSSDTEYAAVSYHP
ncbi:uncharacterized protein LOC121512028 isoform X2 [Cheilinus undulatus]|uniref:uncharacterized protein LOC121512028 isoform X2 n=1 Tax=Cheilinus undulatus TaxID=241271 RepID=UPI001BD6AF19|nr:uncharacterized protein LOC121512028 isoform X2 [Cheilinus undulatus]